MSHSEHQSGSCCGGHAKAAGHENGGQIAGQNGAQSAAKPCCRAAAPAPSPTGVALTTLQPGQTGVICETCLEPDDAALLRAMGLRPNATIRLCRLGEPCIVEVIPGVPGSGDKCDRPGGCSCRIGLSKPLADRVMIGAPETTSRRTGC